MSGKHASPWVEKNRNATDFRRPLTNGDYLWIAAYTLLAIILLFLVPALVGPPEYNAGQGSVENAILGTNLLKFSLSGIALGAAIFVFLLRKAPKWAMAMAALTIGVYAHHVRKDREQGFR